MFLKFLLALLALFGSIAHSQEPSVTKMTCREIKFHPKENAAARPKVELEGVVTCIPDGWKGFFVADSTGGVYCEPLDSDAESTFWPVTVGERIVLQGVISEGHLNSFVLVERVTARALSQLPDSVELGLEKVVREVHDADFVRVRGIMVRITNIAGEMEYGLVANGKECDVVHASFRIDPKLPIHTEVEISGVVIPTEGRSSFKIVVPTKECFRVLRSQEQLYAETPILSIESILGKSKFGQLVRFRAQVFRRFDAKTWLRDSRFGIEWIGKLDPAQKIDGTWEFAGLQRSDGDRVFIEYGNAVARLAEQTVDTEAKTIEAPLDQDFLNQIIKTQGSLVDRHTIDGSTYLVIENRHGRWSVNADSSPRSESIDPLVFGATYSVTGLLATSTSRSQESSIILGDKTEIKYLAAPPLSPWHRLAFSVFITALLTIGLVASMISYRHLSGVKNRLEIAQSELSLANESLESRIEERTKELQSLNNALTIAERKANDANEAKSAFLANMSHEIRTPMTAILGFTEILRDDSELTSSERQSFLETIHRNGDHLLSVIDEILDLAKIESGKLSIHCEEVDPAAMIKEIVSLLEVKAIAKKLAIECTVSPDAPVRIWTDPTRLKQILVNLIGNAVKFTEVGKIAVHLASESASADRMRIEVTDSGIGISEEHLPRLFNAFEQSDNSSTRVYGGTGLGLSITKSLVRMLDGDILVRSQLGKGSCFQVVLPIGTDHFRDNPTVLFARTRNDQTQRHVLQNVRVLFAEDGVDNQKLIAFHLRHEGAQVQLVENGLQMVEAMCESAGGKLISPCPYDLIITDMQMPTMDGYTAVDLLRRKGCQIPVVALTAHAMSEDADKCIQAGCDIYLSKPIDRMLLLTSCTELLQRKGGKSKIGPAA